MYFITALNKVHTSKILLRAHKTCNYYQIPRATIFTRDRTTNDAKIFLFLSKPQVLEGIKSKFYYAKRLLIDNILKRVTGRLATDLQRLSAWKLFNGNTSPFYTHCNSKANIFTRDRTTRDVKFLLHSPKQSELKGIQSKYNYAKRLLVDNVLKRVSNSLAADLRRRSARQLFNGNSSPLLALVGTSLVSGSKITTKENEFEGVCWEIRESIGRMRKNLFKTETCEFEENLSLASLEFGSVIAKGSNAVVYEARKKAKTDKTPMSKPYENDNYPLAVKMMFNYDAESNAIAILRSMFREMVPLQNISAEANISNFWENELSKRIQRLPPHINVVKMYKSFTDYVPELPDSQILYPNALPFRLNPEGFGRNMSLFLVMKKYKMNLRQFLEHKTPNSRDGILLLTQLLEAITHFNKYEIAHRDLKSDNILLDLKDGEESCPLLVVTDFGSCLSDKHFGLSMPFKTPDVDRGGNAALMAPEVINAHTGMFSSIDYSKSDVWTAGTLAYEIFTKQNPFYQCKTQQNEHLRNTTYTEDMLPELPAEVPLVISRLIQALLTKNPAKRLDAELAATICQIHLWAPSQWLLSTEKLPSNNEILQWLLSLTTKVLYEGPILFKDPEKKRTSFTEYQLLATFLQRIKLRIVRKALCWIHELMTIG